MERKSTYPFLEWHFESFKVFLLHTDFLDVFFRITADPESSVELRAGVYKLLMDTNYSYALDRYFKSQSLFTVKQDRDRTTLYPNMVDDRNAASTVIFADDADKTRTHRQDSRSWPGSGTKPAHEHYLLDVLEPLWTSSSRNRRKKNTRILVKRIAVWRNIHWCNIEFGVDGYFTLHRQGSFYPIQSHNLLDRLLR